MNLGTFHDQRVNEVALGHVLQERAKAFKQARLDRMVDGGGYRLLDLREVERRLKARSVDASPTGRINRTQPEMQHLNPLVRRTGPALSAIDTDFATLEQRVMAYVAAHPEDRDIIMKKGELL